MPKVKFIEHSLEADVPVGITVLQASRLAGAPEGDACGGVCACSTCHVYIDQGLNLLSPAEENEEDILDKAFDVQMTSRLGCQARILRDGELVIRISKESQEAFANEHG